MNRSRTVSIASGSLTKALTQLLDDAEARGRAEGVAATRESVAVELESLLGRCTPEDAVVVRACASIARGRPTPTDEQRAWGERVVAEATP